MNKSILISMIILLFYQAACIAQEMNEPKKEFAGLPLIFSDDFEQGIDRWEVLDPKTWRLNEHQNNTTFEITERDSDYKPPFRSPWHVALIKDLVVSDFVLEFKVRSTQDTGAHRDCCVLFCFENKAKFYYLHLGALPDDHSDQIMIVNDAPRVALTKNKNPTPWTDDWHHVRLVFNSDLGKTEVYFDDFEKPHMLLVDKTLSSGKLAIGSFDDCNEFDDIRLYGKIVKANSEQESSE